MIVISLYMVYFGPPGHGSVSLTWSGWHESGEYYHLSYVRTYVCMIVYGRDTVHNVKECTYRILIILCSMASVCTAFTVRVQQGLQGW